jgi:hypothetical protein
MQMFERKDSDLADKIKGRSVRLKELLRNSNPRLVICYGHTKSGEYADLLEIKWRSVNDRIFESADSRCLLLPFFGNGQMRNSDVDQLLQAKLLG